MINKSAAETDKRGHDRVVRPKAASATKAVIDCQDEWGITRDQKGRD